MRNLYPSIPAKNKLWRFKSSLLLIGILILHCSTGFGQFVFSDHFNRTVLSPGGTPSLAYVFTTTGTGSISMASNSYLQVVNGPNSSSGSNGRTYVTGPLTAYAAPFNRTLNLNSGIITWTFNARTNKSSTAGGFENGKEGVAVVLVANGTNLAATGSGIKGYAVVYGGQGANFIKSYRLVKFNNGLSADASLTNVISSVADNFSSNQAYVSIRVTYNPSNNSWSLFLRDDGGSAWSDPSSAVNTLLGTATDATYTGIQMNQFGFFFNHSSTSGLNCQFDNFDVNIPPLSPTLYVNPASLVFANQQVGTNSASQSFNLSGLALTGFPGNITVNAPAQFQVSNNNSTWGNSTTIAYASGTLTQTPVYVRFSPTTAGCAITGNITFSGGGVVSPPTVALSGISSTVIITNPAPVCSPSTVNLTAAAVTTGSTAGLTYTYWTNPAATAALSSPNAVSVSGTYYIKGTNPAGGCTDIQPVVVTVNLPSVAPTGAVATPAVICKGSSTTLTQTGGTLGTGATWKWYTNPAMTALAGTSVAADASLSLSPLLTTTYYVRSEGGTAPCSTGNTGSASVTVTVNIGSIAPTGAVATPAVICKGGSTTLTQAGGTLGTGATWYWYTNASFTTLAGTSVAADASLFVSPVATTTYYVRAEGGTAPCLIFNTTAKSVTVTVNQPSVDPTGAVATPAIICNGGSTVLTQAGGILGTGASWHWYTDAAMTIAAGTSILANAAITVSPVVTTTYYVRAEGGTAPCAANSSSADITVTVNIRSLAPTSASASNLTLCNGGSTILALNGGGGGTNETIAWYSGSCDGTLVGTGNDLLVSPAITTTYFGRFENGSPCNFVTACVSVTINVNASGTWLGVSNNWNDASNWCGGIPGNSTNVYIPVVGPWLYYPLTSTATARANNIMIAAGASVVVSNYLLQIAGVIDNAGTFDASNGTIELNGTSAQTIGANSFQNNAVSNLVISNSSVTGVSLNAPLDIYRSLTFTGSGSKLSTGGYLTLKSTAQETAWLGNLTGHLLSGDISVERYIATGDGGAPDHGKSWQLLAVPTSGQTIKQSWQENALTANGNPNPGFGTMLTSNVANAASQPTPGFDVYTPSGPTIKTYNYLSNGFSGVASTALPVYNQKGYFILVRGDRSVTAYNQAPNATVLRTKGTLFSPSNPPPVTAVIDGKFESIGNPYASAVDIRSISTSGGVEEFFYVWDPRLGGANSLGAFQTLYKEGDDYFASPGGGSYGSGATNFIQSGQAFLVHASGSNGNVEFTEATKAGGSELLMRTANLRQPSKSIKANLYQVNADGSPSLTDAVISFFGNNYSNEVNAEDAKKQNNLSENLSIKSIGGLLAIERRALLNREDTIFLNFSGQKLLTYRFEIIARGLNNGRLKGFVEDNYLHTRTALNLDGSTVLDFNIVNIAGSWATDRFRIVFSRSSELPITLNATGGTQSVLLEWQTNQMEGIKFFELQRSVDGSAFSALSTMAPGLVKGTLNSDLSSMVDGHPLKGSNFYRIWVLDHEGRSHYSGVEKVLMGEDKTGIIVYPNPVRGGVINLKFNNEAMGLYQLKLINNLGQVIFKKQVNHSKGKNETIIVDRSMQNGTYQLEIISPNGDQKLLKILSQDR